MRAAALPVELDVAVASHDGLALEVLGPVQLGAPGALAVVRDGEDEQGDHRGEDEQQHAHPPHPVTTTLDTALGGEALVFGRAYGGAQGDAQPAQDVGIDGGVVLPEGDERLPRGRRRANPWQGAGIELGGRLGGLEAGGGRQGREAAS